MGAQAEAQTMSAVWGCWDSSHKALDLLVASCSYKFLLRFFPASTEERKRLLAVIFPCLISCSLSREDGGMRTRGCVFLLPGLMFSPPLSTRLIKLSF